MKLLLLVRPGKIEHPVFKGTNETGIEEGLFAALPDKQGFTMYLPQGTKVGG